MAGREMVMLEIDEEAARAIDEAKVLLDLKNKTGVSFFRLLRRALTRANERNSSNGGIFAVFVDTNSRVHDFTPPPTHNDSSSHTAEHEANKMLFVLTHTMDVLCETPDTATLASEGAESRQTVPFDYKASVTSDDIEAQWGDLISMGRPLWKTFLLEELDLVSQQKPISNLAASKLLLGQSMSFHDSYNGSTLFGIAALLCRLGLRSHSGSSLSTNVAANFMGVLSYVSFTNDNHFTSYPSETIWLSGRHACGISSNKRLIRINVGQISPRRISFTPWRWRNNPSTFPGNVDAAGCRYCDGRDHYAFVSERRYQDEIQRSNLQQGQVHFRGTVLRSHTASRSTWKEREYENLPAVVKETGDTFTDKEEGDYQAWMKTWEGWQMSFSQFEELPEEPTTDKLWELLGRRAAGVRRRNQRAADLVIPIFRRDTISFILVQVVNREQDDPLRLSNFLKEADLFMTAGVRDMI